MQARPRIKEQTGCRIDRLPASGEGATSGGGG